MFSVFFTEENQLPEEEVKKIRREKTKYNQIVEEIIKEGMSQGLFRRADPKLQAFAITGMCNWVYKWYKPGDSFFTSDQIADHFVSLLERGYLLIDKQPIENLVEAQRRITKFPEPKKDKFKKLKDQCLRLIELIDETEKSS